MIGQGAVELDNNITMQGQGIVVTPTISIYQDAVHIEGILQQSNKGLVTDSELEGDVRDTQTSETGIEGSGGLGAEVKLPGVGSVKAEANLGGDERGTSEAASGQRTTHRLRYTSAFYLHHVRQDLQAANLLRRVQTTEEVEHLSVGDFVEFQAKFAPDELISLMDVFNPELVAAFTKWIRKGQLMTRWSEAEDEEQKQAIAGEFQIRPDADAEFARAVAEAIRVDFRSTATREFYGAIASAPDVTAVVVCDLRSFLVDDADRILDGHFTVLGKVSTPPETDVPVLARNKVLDRIKPDAVDYVSTELLNLAKKQVESRGTGNSDQKAMDQYVDLHFPSRIEGTSFKVIPIAIYI